MLCVNGIPVAGATGFNPPQGLFRGADRGCSTELEGDVREPLRNPVRPLLADGGPVWLQ